MPQRKGNLTRILEALYLGTVIIMFICGLFGVPIIIVSEILIEGWTIGTLICFPFWLLMVALTVFTIALWIRDTIRELASLATVLFTH